MARRTRKATGPKDPQQEARQDQDLQFTTEYARSFYPGRKEGPGRAVVLTAAGIQLGYLWTNDEDGLGFVAVSDAGIQRTPEFATAFSKAKDAGTPASEVFDYYAGLASQGLSA